MAHLTINFKSGAINMPIMLDVLLPEQSAGCKTLYLLHGMGGDREAWLLRSRVADYAEEKNIAVVMPSGNNKFFLNNINGKAYQTFVTEELPAQMELWFGVSSNAADRFIAGADMGGFGALLAAIDRPEFFHTAFSYHNIAYLKEMCRTLDEGVLRTVFGTMEECESLLEALEKQMCTPKEEAGLSNTMYVIYEQPEKADWLYLDECIRETIGFIASEGGASCR